MARGFFKALDRLGLIKYALATLFTVVAFVLTAGAYLLDQLSRRPPEVRKLPAAWLAGPAKPQPKGWIVRAPVSNIVRYSAASQAPSGFSFYDVAAEDTPQTLGAKLSRNHLTFARVRGEACDFAQPLGDGKASGGAVAGFIRDRGRECCDIAPVLPRQLATYGFGPDHRARPASPTGTAVFSDLGAGLLTLTMRFTDHLDDSAETVSRYLTRHFGPLADRPGKIQSWTRDGGLVTVRRTPHALVVTAYFAVNIERHAAIAQARAERRTRPDIRSGSRLALATTPTTGE